MLVESTGILVIIFLMLKTVIALNVTNFKKTTA